LEILFNMAEIVDSLMEDSSALKATDDPMEIDEADGAPQSSSGQTGKAAILSGKANLTEYPQLQMMRIMMVPTTVEMRV
jgi:hypothetical protein